MSGRAWVETAALAALVLTSCSKSASPDATGPAASTHAAQAAPSASTAKAAPASSGTSPAAASNWAGSYTAKVGAVAPPENAKEKTWTEDPGTAAVGGGTIAMSIAGSGGETRGETKGPLGEMTIAGVFDGRELRANLLPKDPKADGAMTGFMLLTAASGAPASTLKGTLRVSNRDARIVRAADVEVSKK